MRLKNRYEGPGGTLTFFLGLCAYALLLNALGVI